METLRIEIDENGSDQKERKALIRDTMSVSVRYRSLQKDHRCRIPDVFRETRTLMIAGGAVFAVLLALSLLWGFDTFQTVCLALLGIETVLCAVYLAFLYKTAGEMVKRTGTSALILDGECVELRTQETGTFRINWRNVAVIRIFRNAVSFVSADGTGLILSVSRDNEGKIVAWLRENPRGTEIVTDD